MHHCKCRKKEMHLLSGADAEIWDYWWYLLFFQQKNEHSCLLAVTILAAENWRHLQQLKLGRGVGTVLTNVVGAIFQIIMTRSFLHFLFLRHHWDYIIFSMQCQMLSQRCLTMGKESTQVLFLQYKTQSSGHLHGQYEEENCCKTDQNSRQSENLKGETWKLERKGEGCLERNFW